MILARPQVKSAIIPTEPREGSKKRYASEITHSDPFTSPIGQVVQCKYVSTGTLFVTTVDDLNKDIALATALGFGLDDSFTDLSQEPATV